MPRGKREPAYVGKPPEVVRAFQSQRTMARRRGIEFLFTFQEWWDWWQVDNRWANRGVQGHQLVMARFGDKGPYSADNVYCATQAQNMSDVPFEVRSEAQKKAWRTHPNKAVGRGERQWKARPVETPAGRFGCAADAARHHGITRQGATYRARAGVQGWRFAPKQIAAE